MISQIPAHLSDELLESLSIVCNILFPFRFLLLMLFCFWCGFGFVLVFGFFCHWQIV